MKIDKNMIVVVMITFCFIATMFMVIPIRSGITGAKPPYDPWLDTDDNGQIDMGDITTELDAFGATGTAINKTELLIQVNATYAGLLSRIDSLNSYLSELQSKVDGMNATNLMPLIDSLNSSLIQLQSGVNVLNATVIQLQTSNGNLNASLSQLQTTVNTLNNTLSAQINTLQGQIDVWNTTITQLQNSEAALNNRVTNLEGNYSSLLDRVSALEGNYSVTNLKLAPYAIPFNMTCSMTHYYTTETAGFVDMPLTSVTLTLNRTSQLLIMFSACAGISAAAADEKTAILCQAQVNGIAAMPNGIQLTPLISVESPAGLTHAHRVTEGAFCYNFYFGPVSAGTYTIKMRWYLSGYPSSGTGDVWNRALEVIGLPA